MDGYYFLRRSYSASHIRSETNAFRQNIGSRRNSYSSLARTRSVDNLSAYQPTIEPYKPRWSFSAHYLQSKYFEKDHYYNDRMYSYSPNYYRTLLYSNNYWPRGSYSLYNNYTYPYLTSRSWHRYPYNYSITAPYRSYYSIYNPYSSNYTYYKSSLISSY
uniref:Uncharacterized protein n=1 Tax=Ditylenchus dipsaci TaxID=166011 RepID=A0A915DFL0_9BILA